MRKTTKQNRLHGDMVEDCTLHETMKLNDEKTRAAMAYGHRKPYAMTMHGGEDDCKETDGTAGCDLFQGECG